MSELKTLFKKRSAIKSKLTIFGNHIKLIEASKALTELQIIDLECCLRKFEPLFEEFDTLQTEIEILSDEPSVDEVPAERVQFDNDYYPLVARAKSLLAAGKKDSGSVAEFSDAESGGRVRNLVRLPKIDLPHFSGGYQDWLEFKDTFLSLIHNSDCIDNINKFHYLRASLKGNAALIIKNIDFKSDNYTIAWELLCERFDNSRLLINNHLQALFNIEPIRTESCKSIQNLIDVTNKNIRALASLKEPIWDTIIIYMMSTKLDSVTGREWEEHRNTLTSSPTLSQFITFLSKRADILETLEENKINKLKSEPVKAKSLVINNNNSTNSKNTNKNYKRKSCPLCDDESHQLFNCESFRSLPVESRISKVREFKVCLNCLRFGHVAKKCFLSNCKYCNEKHNTLLHLEKPEQSASRDSSSTSSKDIVLTTSDNILPVTTPTRVFLSTALVKVVDGKGNKHTARAILDNGSGINIVSEALCSKLDLPRRNVSSTVSGFNNHVSHSTQSCNLTIESLNSSYRNNIDCFVFTNVTTAVPITYIDTRHIQIPAGLCLSDPTYYVPSKVDILLGADIFWDILGNKRISLGKHLPVLRSSELGWIVTGHISSPKGTLSQCLFTQDQLDIDLTRFWEVDCVSLEHSQSAEERACEHSFTVNTTRDKEGRYVVTIPLKQDPLVLGDSFEMAKRRFLSLERKFEREPIFKEKYLNFMKEYELLGHMTENTVLFPYSDTANYYLPHHGVLRESSTTTKLRTVFDASAVTTSGISFNEIQMVGPTVQDDLLSILLRFRQHKFVISADIEKMFRSIKIVPSQRSLQQIVFRYDSSHCLKTYTLNTVCQGTASAPYLATKCLSTLASTVSDSNVKYSIAHDFYCDDLLSGASTVSEAIDLCKGITATLNSAKLNIRKWKSNNTLILNELFSGQIIDSNTVLDLSDNNTSKTLGLYWLCQQDTLSFSINIELHEKVTKRHILSVISQIFDPLGLVGPCVVEAKLIMQKLWVNKCSWDEEVSSEILHQWSVFANTLPCLNKLQIPRWVLSDLCVKIEIHIFTDASQSAYGACVYIRSVCNSGLVRVQLLVSKNKVAPIKPTTIPRLELCGALLGARLCTKVQNSLTLNINTCRFWCDSTIVLGWLSTPTIQLNQFVRNRVNEIKESTSGYTWSYVPSKENPADLVSRGVKADIISDASLWWSGPSFLLEPEHSWPQMPNETQKRDLPDLQPCLVINNDVSKNDDDKLFTKLILKYSQFTRLQRVIAYIHRFIYNCKTKTNRFRDHLTCEELQRSFNFIIHIAQLEMFPNEYFILKSGQALPKKNKLISLTPFLDSSDILRVGGRLDNSPYSYDTKHPILLCGKHHLTKIIFYMHHLKLLHAGPQLLLSSIRQTFWPLGGRNLSKSITKACIKCFRFKASNVQPIMGQLPESRTTLEFPFLHCSVDYAGPVKIANRKGRGCQLIKSYLSIFVCLATKAVHLELVTDLTKEGFMAALNRFVARRGKPQSITSDNGTNFVGTSNELHRFLQDSSSQISSAAAQEGIDFLFIPSYTPHFNGMAESAVRSTKYHLRRLLQLTHFTYEEMHTCLTQVEAILNSRPITALNSDPTDFTPLTPAHFLIGRPLVSVPHPQLTERITSLERYKRIEFVKQHFWKRFSNEYITTLQQKTKWSTASSELKLGSLVLIKDKTLPPLRWALGRCVAVFPGTHDQVARVADIRIKGGTIIRRAFNNICPLPEADS
ncbi:hypothetical protein PYW08_011981 [Mythimna loreyi]|uniref:Uncharacterized protein n=1 Tax=Mythimna loreyi TaxID=667449 RepID=A0ACC2QKZ6_9NEOP|nr:hypothetical protein PYW08_011981 [Mythimna loreyi]